MWEPGNVSSSVFISNIPYCHVLAWRNKNIVAPLIGSILVVSEWLKSHLQVSSGFTANTANKVIVSLVKMYLVRGFKDSIISISLVL